MVAYQPRKFYLKSLGIIKFFYEFGKSKASERTIVDEALVGQNLLDSKCYVHLFFELYQKYITKFTHLSIVAD